MCTASLLRQAVTKLKEIINPHRNRIITSHTTIKKVFFISYHELKDFFDEISLWMKRYKTVLKLHKIMSYAILLSC